MKIKCELNVQGQPIGGSGKTFKRWLGTFCLSHVFCPLVPTAWTSVSTSHKVDCWIEIEKRWIIDLEIIQPADQMAWAMHQLGELRRNRRSKLKRKCYKDDASRADVIAKKRLWADKQQFLQLVDYWFHQDTWAKESRQAVERAVLFAKVYSTKDGHPVIPEVGEKIND